MNVESGSAIKIALAGMIGIAAAMGIGRFVFTPILPGMMDALSLSASQAGLIAAANYVGYLAGALLAVGSWATGRERAMVLAGMFSSAALAASMGLTDNLIAFLVIRFAAGVASAFVMVFLSSIVFEQLAAKRREELSAWFFVGVGIGIAVSALLIAALLQADAGWQAGWLWSGAISLPAAIALVFLIDVPPKAHRARPPEPPITHSSSLSRIILGYGLFGMGYIVTATFLVAIVRQGAGGRMFEAWVWLATGIAGIFSIWLWNRVASRVGLFRAYALGCIVEMVGVIGSVSLGGHIGPLLGGILLGGTFIAITAFGLRISRPLAGLSPRRILALMTASFGTGQIIGPILAGYLADWTGSFFAPSLAAAAALAVSAALVLSVSTPAPKPA